MNRAPDNLPRGYDWRDDGLCRNPVLDPELWHPAGTTGHWAVQIGNAKQICFACPVLTTCRQWALDNREPHGIWGGLTEQERSSWRRRLQRAAADGTEPAKPRTPVIVYGSHEKAYRANVLPDGDHLVWVGGNEVKVDGARLSPNQTVWWATRGEAPVGRVFTDCDHDGCVLHLTDQATRDARQAAEKAAREAARQASKCGTRPGYQLHRQRGEQACQPCKDANAAADRRLHNTGTTKQAAGVTARCGTAEGYQAHRRWSEAACQPCLDAHRAAARTAADAPSLPSCGTRTGYDTHVTRGEAPCRPCTEARASTGWLLRTTTPERSAA